MPPSRTLLVSPAGCGKTRHILERFKAALRKRQGSPEPPLAFLLPSEEHAARIHDLLLRASDVEAVPSRCVTTLERFVECWLAARWRPVVSMAAKFALLREILARPDGASFAEVRDLAGFVRLVSDFITELKRSFVGPNVFRERMEALARTFPAFKPKYEALASLYASYQEVLAARGLLDLDDAFFFLAREVREGKLKAPRLAAVWVDGFHDFTPLQLEWIKILAEHSEEITVTLTFDADAAREPLFGAVRETRDALLALDFKESALGHTNHRAKRADLAHLERGLFREDLPPCEDPPSSLQVLEAVGAEGEMEAIAREISRLYRAEPYNYSDFCVILRQIGATEGLARSIFSAYGIPVEIHERRKLRANPLVRTVLAALDLWAGEWQRAHVLRYLKSSYAGYDPAIAARIEIAALDRGVRKGRGAWLEGWKGFGEEEERLKLFGDLARAEDALRAAKSAQAFVRAFGKFLAARRFHAQLARSSDEQSAEDGRALAALDRILEALAHERDGAGGFEAWTRRLRDAIDVALYSTRSHRKNKVQVYDISLARQKEYKVVFAAGLLEGQFPLAIREDPLLSDEERVEFNKGAWPLRLRRPRQALERYLFYLALTRAEERLYLTYPRYDLEGRPMLPSFYVEDVRRLFTRPLASAWWGSRRLPERLTDAVSREEATRATVSGFFSRRSARSPGEPLLRAAYGALLADEDFKKLLPELFASVEAKLANAKLFPVKDTFSPTGLELYGRCPYRYFADHWLMLQDNEEEATERRMGAVMHKVLEHYKELVQLAPRALAAKLEELTGPLLDEALAPGEPAYRRRLLAAGIVRALERMILREREKPLFEGFTFYKPELAFEFDWDGLKLKGRMDRVDRSGNRAVVIDYKRTGKGSVLPDILWGTHLQLPIYEEALARAFSLQPVGAFLYSLLKGKRIGYYDRGAVSGEWPPRQGFPKERLAEYRAAAERFARRYAQGIARGEMPVKPRDCDTTCPFDALCRIQKWDLERIYEEHERNDRTAAART